MIFPIGDSPNPRGIPAVTWLLLALNVAVYVLVTLPLSTPADPADPLLPEYVRLVASRAPEVPLRDLLARITTYDLFVYRYAFRPAAPSLSGLFVSLFLHAHFLHLFGNMLFLWIYGDNVEHRLGPGRFLLAYLGTGVAATLFHAAFSPASPIPLIGASGAISGVLGFYFRWFPYNQVRLLVLLPLFTNVYLVSARVVLTMYLLVDNLLPFLATQGADGGGVAYGAHIGGFLAGYAATWLMDRRAITAGPPEYRRGGLHDGTPEAAAQRVRQLMADGEYAGAAELYFSQPAGAMRGALPPEQALALAEWLRRNGHSEAALVLYRRLLRDVRDAPVAAAAHVGAALVLLDDLNEPALAYQHLVDALRLDPGPDLAARARAAMQRIAQLQKFPLARHPGRPLRW